MYLIEEQEATLRGVRDEYQRTQTEESNCGKSPTLAMNPPIFIQLVFRKWLQMAARLINSVYARK
jgi:hypothetical protein